MTMNRFAALQAWPRSPGGLRRLLGRAGDIVGREQDEGIGATELEHHLLEVPPGDLRDGAAGSLGARDRYAAHTRVGDDPCDLLVRGVDVAVGAVGEAGVMEDLRDRLGRFGHCGACLRSIVLPITWLGPANRATW